MTKTAFDVLSYFCPRHWTWHSDLLNPESGSCFPINNCQKKKKIAATEGTIFHWETAPRFTVQKIQMPHSMSGAKVTEYLYCVLLLCLNLFFRPFRSWPFSIFPDSERSLVHKKQKWMNFTGFLSFIDFETLKALD